MTVWWHVQALGLGNEGQGACTCRTPEELATAIREIAVDCLYGHAGDVVMIQRLEPMHPSLLTSHERRSDAAAVNDEP